MMRRGKTTAQWLIYGCLLLSATAMGRTYNLDQKHIPDQLIVKFKEGIASKSAASLLAQSGASVLHQFKSGAVLVSFNNKSMPTATLTAKASTLAAAESIEYVEANQILHINATLPNDPRFGELYGLHNTGSTGGTSGADIKAVDAWDISTGSRDVVVGVIDTGIDYTHPDIAANYWSNPGESGVDAEGRDRRSNGVDDDGNGFVDDWRGWDFVNNDNDPMDDNSHGTHCAGTIGGVGNDGVGVVGVNWNVSMVGIKFLSGAGSGSLADAVKAIEYGTSLGVTLTSNSWGGGGYSETMDAAIRGAEAAGILFIAAAGNSSSDNDRSPHYPSSYTADNVIAVAATDHSDVLANFSSYGATSVDLSAPGVDILSSVPNGRYEEYSGTSMATPHVAGVAALVKAAYPEATADQIKARILNSVDPVPALQGKTLTGGRLNAFHAMIDDKIAPNAVTGLGVLHSGTTFVHLQWFAAGDDGDQGRARRYELRYAATPIDSEEAWAAATPAALTITETEGLVSAMLEGLAFNSSGYLALKAIDKVGNIGPLSESLPFAVAAVRKVFEHDAESLDDTTADSPWNVEAYAGRGGNVFSDSPESHYSDNTDVSLTLAPVRLSSSDATLAFAAQWDLESNYDFAHVEASTDNGATWVRLDRLTGNSGWVNKSYSLANIVGDASNVQIRFRVTSDGSITRDGILIDDVVIFAPVE